MWTGHVSHNFEKRMQSQLSLIGLSVASSILRRSPESVPKAVLEVMHDTSMKFAILVCLFDSGLCRKIPIKQLPIASIRGYYYFLHALRGMDGERCVVSSPHTQLRGAV
ncbi:unnamed protein product [Arctogadus glacialis]